MPRPRSKERSFSTGTLRSAGQQIDLATLLEEHSYPVPGLNWLPADLLPGWIQTYGMECGPEAIAPWNPNFEFGVTAVLGEGADVFHGTPNDDSAEHAATGAWVETYPGFSCADSSNPVEELGL